MAAKTETARRSVTFTIPTPPSLNNLFKNLRGRGGRAATKKYLDWQLEAQYRVKSQRPKSLTGSVTVAIIYPDAGQSDLDNLCKAVLDLAVKLKIIQGDSRKWVRAISLAWGNVTETRVTFTDAVAA